MSSAGHTNRIVFSVQLARAAMLGCLALLAGCLETAPKQPTVSTNELSFSEAIVVATDGLVGQTQKLPAFLAKMESKIVRKNVVVDPMIDATSGQQTQTTQLLERRIGERLAARKEGGFDLLPFKTENLSKVQYLLTGTLTRLLGVPGKKSLQINLALVELKTGQVVAQASALARDDGLNHTPLAIYQDSPVLVKDRVVDGYISTALTAPGSAANSTYMERVSVASVINEAGSLYNAERYQESLAKYQEARGQTGGEQLRTLNGIYLNNVRLGRTAEAEWAFGQIVAYGLRANKLDVKFLFNPGSTEFWSDTKVSGAYPMWLRQIAKEGSGARVCMVIVGHTSHTGSEQTNDALSLQRATFIQQRLATEAPTLAQRIKASGMGWRENLVGSGSDNAVDALDRRVEFRVEPCN
ncbi:outer membrane protein OmpA-like peptidoglycan-associated protein [Pelomonas saccharophila]|uniref:Outer membrane protein OmpA-like peptidoglycan-associated protein n=1 Tax=Roseateles saccharophilus TaxID=304 RepID=A0ABU1YIN5_ROSSA|nr:OmpA family protein [Roseateles saccharophilus]MDR7268688.1 outer membrane protein OmpA-like peptidoglycan-associated protein [Roseateles saccharophilus]